MFFLKHWGTYPSFSMRSLQTIGYDGGLKSSLQTSGVTHDLMVDDEKQLTTEQSIYSDLLV